MAVVYERLEGTDLVKAYSDAKHYIISNESGVLYAEAVDPDFMNRTYTESDRLIEEEELPDDRPEEM